MNSHHALANFIMFPSRGINSLHMNFQRVHSVNKKITISTPFFQELSVSLVWLSGSLYSFESGTCFQCIWSFDISEALILNQHSKQLLGFHCVLRGQLHACNRQVAHAGDLRGEFHPRIARKVVVVNVARLGHWLVGNWLLLAF